MGGVAGKAWVPPRPPPGVQLTLLPGDPLWPSRQATVRALCCPLCRVLAGAGGGDPRYLCLAFPTGTSVLDAQAPVGHRAGGGRAGPRASGSLGTLGVWLWGACHQPVPPTSGTSGSQGSSRQPAAQGRARASGAAGGEASRAARLPPAARGDRVLSGLLSFAVVCRPFFVVKPQNSSQHEAGPGLLNLDG